MGVTLGSLWDQFGVSLGSVWVSVGDFAAHDGHFAIIVESLRYIKVRFQKTFIFHTYSNDFIKPLGVIWVDLGLLWDHFWHIRVTLGPL